LVVDPTSFEFKDGFLKGTAYRYYFEKKDDETETAFFLWEDGQRSFVSNKPELMETFLNQNEDCSSYFKNKIFLKGFYWRPNKIIQDLEIIETGQKIYGCVSF
jgi:hypothetical protein